MYLNCHLIYLTVFLIVFFHTSLMCTSIGIPMNFRSSKKVVLNSEKNTRHAACETQIEREVVWLFVILFVGIKPEKLHAASCVGRKVNPLGVITHGQRHKPRAHQRQRYRPRKCRGRFLFCVFCRHTARARTNYIRD